MDSENPLKTIATAGSLDRRRNWYVFRVFNLYRLILAALLLGAYAFSEETRILGKLSPQLFAWTGLVYVLLVLVALGLTFLRRPSMPVQAHIQALADILCLSLMIHASGGVVSNLSVLLVISVAASSILLPLLSALLMAALAFLVTTGQWLYSHWYVFTALPQPWAQPGPALWDGFFRYLSAYNDELGRLGILGASLLIAALLTYTLAERTRRTEELARQKTQELLEAAELNQAIIRHLQSGIIVVDRLVRIRLINDTARDLLNVHGPVVGLPLSEVSLQLSQRLAGWLSAGVNMPKPFRQDEHLPDITPSFTHLSGNLAYDTLIFLEDSAQVAQRLQQIKLAALGRLTAGIAHEIRNPLASISHAAQLLGESTSASASDRRLGQIIHDNAKRASRIITNVLDMSKRDKLRPEDFALKPWLEHFCREFLRGHREPKPKIEIRVQPAELFIRFDPSHLHQVLWNLCQNASAHGTPPDQLPRFRLAAGLDAIRHRPYLDVIDFGPGIPETEARKIFEPFFTTKPRGTGLGLYIAREMCEANRAQLQYLRSPEGGSCFRITFAQTGRQDREPQWKYGTH
ncbi:MAG TPA: ATP-binding protein [Candidatus Competibacteraceae bacterium]|nr:ATP-binding protein [Candidatus Competibacteraceae bacterium]